MTNAEVKRDRYRRWKCHKPRHKEVEFDRIEIALVTKGVVVVSDVLGLGAFRYQSFGLAF